MPRQNKEQAVTNALREEGLKIIASDKATSTEKMHWSKLLFDMQDVTKQELTVQVKQAEDAREAAESTLKTVQDALAAANAKVAELEPSALRLPAVEAELADLRTNFDAKTSQARKELVEESRQNMFKAQRSENAAKDTLATAQSQFGARGQQILLDFVQKLVEQFSIPEPAPETLPAGISPLVLTLWGHSPTKAQLMLAYHKSFPEPSEGFRQTLLRLLKTKLPLQTFAGMELPKPIENLAEKIEVLTAMAQRWNVWTDIQQSFQEMQVERQTEFLRAHHASMAAQEHDAACRGEGRSPIGQQEPVSSVPLSEHGLNCECRICSPGLRRPNSLDVIEETF